MTTADRMFTLFRGHSGGHGTYGQEERSAGKAKTEIKKTARTLREPPTPDLWHLHLEGRRPLGIIPVNSHGECWWGVIDVDKYDLSHMDIVRRIAHLKLPLIVCRSKSGGAHLFLFCSEPVPSTLIISKLREWAAVLGYGDCEIFPKQTEILEEKGDLGNWLNMPYYDASRGQRYAISSDGKGLSVEKFLTLAESSRVSQDQLESTTPGSASEDPDLADGPPCLQYLAGVGVGEGGRNNALFAFGVLAKKKFPDNWEQRVEDWNRRFFSPPLGTEEVLIIIRSLRKKDYSYRCKDQPICSHCDARACKGRKYGVGQDATPDISSISILDTTPPLFFVVLTSGGTVECSSEDILSSRAFQKTALEQLRTLLPLYKQDAWIGKVQECLEQAVLIEAPREVGTAGAFHDLLEQFCTDRHAAQARDEILLGKPWLDEESGRYFFRLSDLMSHLERAKFREMTRQQVTARIREMGGGHDFFNLRGRGANVWWIDETAFSVQSEPHAPPRTQETPI